MISFQTITNNFRSMANDIYSAGRGEFSTSRNFDVLTYPNRLFPLPSMTSDTASTLIGNIIIGHDGVPYGVGDDAVGNSAIYKRSAGVWSIISSSGGKATTAYSMLVDYALNGVKFLFFSGTDGANDGRIVYTDPVGNTTSTHTVTGAVISGVCTIGQGFVHPTTNKLYFPYRTSSGSFIGSYNATGTVWADPSTAPALTLQPQYTVTSMTKYGDYLAIACTTTLDSSTSSSSVNSSVIFLWDMTATTWNQIIEWGDNSLQVLNNVNGYLIGISTFLSNDNTGIVIKRYGGGLPEVIRQKFAIRQDITVAPTVAINSRVNFIHRNRLYFSVNLTGGGTSPIEKGLWCVNERGDMTIERFASTDGSDVSVLAAAYWFDYLLACHTAVGTLTISNSAVSMVTNASSNSIYESAVNPDMTPEEKALLKQLEAFAVYTLPLLSGQSVIAKYRVDSTGSWTTIFTKTSATPDTGLVVYQVRNATAQFTEAYNYEYRLESIGGAVITSYACAYTGKTS